MFNEADASRVAIPLRDDDQEDSLRSRWEPLGAGLPGGHVRLSSNGQRFVISHSRTVRVYQEETYRFVPFCSAPGTNALFKVIVDSIPASSIVASKDKATIARTPLLTNGGLCLRLHRSTFHLS